MPKYRFLNDGEKYQHFLEASNVNQENYQYSVVAKVFENAEILIYNYTDQLNILGMLKVVSFNMGGHGLNLTLIDKETYTLFNVGCVPKKVPGFSLCCHLLPKLTLERTVKISTKGYGNVIYGNTTLMIMRSKTHPRTKTYGHQYAVSVHQAARVLGKEELNKAYRRLEDGEA